MSGRSINVYVDHTTGKASREPLQQPDLIFLASLLQNRDFHLLDRVIKTGFSLH
jgi:hypothetical protein